MPQDFFDTPIEFLKGVGPKKAQTLQKELNIFTFGGFIRHYPFRYVDRSKFYKANEITEDIPYVQLRGKIGNVKVVGEKRAERLTALFHDSSGTIELVWFRGIKWVKESIKPGMEYIIFGKPNLFNGKINIVHPELEPATELNTDRKSTRLNSSHLGIS